MSNFKCPTCGMTNIDCGKAGYKTDREIELEKKILEIEENTWDYDLMTDRISELLSENKRLKKKLEIAVQALEKYAKRENWQDIEIGDEECFSARFEDKGYRTAEKALAKIKEIK